MKRHHPRGLLQLIKRAEIRKLMILGKKLNFKDEIDGPEDGEFLYSIYNHIYVCISAFVSLL